MTGDEMTHPVPHSLVSAFAQRREARLGSALLAPVRLARRGRHATSAIGAIQTPPTLGRQQVTIALISDQYTEAMFEGAFDVLRLHPLVWKRQLERWKPDVVLVESAWRGHADWWLYEVSSVGWRRPDALAPILAYCRRAEIATVFWNKEDPVGFDRFLPAARRFDVIATTDAEAANWYQAVVPTATVSVVPFALNPSVHHPIVESHDVADRTMFAGSWANAEYPERVRQINELLRPSLEDGLLDIFTRRPEQWPAEFQAAIVGELQASEVVGRAKRYASALNVNSVIGSETMMSRRVVELAGSGVPVISGPSLALSATFSGLAIEVNSAEACRHAIESMMEPQSRRNASASAWRRAHLDHAVDQRFSELFELAGISAGGAGRVTPTLVDEQVPTDIAQLAHRFASGLPVLADGRLNEAGGGVRVRRLERALRIPMRLIDGISSIDVAETELAAGRSVLQLDADAGPVDR